MLDGKWTAGPPSLLQFLARSGARLEGLRLADRSLILKIENGSQAVQVRIGPGSDTGMGTGMGMALVVSVRVGQAAGDGAAQGTGKRGGQAGTASAARPKRNGPRASDGAGRAPRGQFLARGRGGSLWRERVVAEWDTDSWMRSRVRRLGRRAHRLMEGGYRDLVAKR